MSRVVELRTRAAQWVFGLLVLCAIAVAGLAPRWAGAVLNPPPGGPILVVTSPSSTFGSYYTEILRNEGLNEFAVADIASVSAATLAAYDVVILAPAALTATQVTTFTNWVNGGGNLIAMAPDAQLAPLLGLTTTGTSLANAYLQINTAAAPGAGLVGQTIQYHGTARSLHPQWRHQRGHALQQRHHGDRPTLPSPPASPAQARPRPSPTTSRPLSSTPARAIRRGRPRSGTAQPPIRSDDKFFGNAPGDAQPDWIDLTKVAIPQADEQQRLLANLILHVNQNKKPLPRFWYFPHGKKAVVIMTGDDHAQRRHGRALRPDERGQPRGLFRGRLGVPARHVLHLLQHAPDRRTGRGLQRSRASRSASTSIRTAATTRPASLQTYYSTQIADWQAKYASMPAPATQRHHCMVWSDWSSGAEVAAGQRHAPGHELLLLAAGLGGQRPGQLSPARPCRCASRRSAAT